jgi:O-antigen/teichoic acid export membrane protein
VSKRTDSPGLGSLASGALTAASTLVVTLVAALAGVVIARELGRTEETDGFFAAYGVFIVIVLAAQSIRISVLPTLARAREEHRLGGELGGFAIAIAFIAMPLVLVAEVAAMPLADLLTGNGSETAQMAASESLRWMVPAAGAHLFAGLAASGLAALDDYATAAAGYASGSLAGLALILARVDSDGISAVAWGMALNGAVALAVPAGALAVRGLRTRMPAGAIRPTGQPFRARIGGFAAAAALPIALQMLYVVCLPFAGRLGTGAVTSFGYAYLAAAGLVTVTAFSLGLVTSVPLSRLGLDAAAAARHVVSVSWIALALIGAAAGVFAIAGSDVVEAVLGDAYGGGVGEEVGRLVVVLSPWMIASVGVNVSFPLVFVAGRTRALPWIGLFALAVQVPLAWIGGAWLDLNGLAIALAATTFLVLGAVLHQLHALAAATRGLAVAAGVVAGIALAAFLPPALVLGSAAAAAVGLVLYVAFVGALRPRGLTASWGYLRALR